MFDIPLVWHSFTPINKPVYFFNWTKEHPLETSHKTIRISLLINLFISLIELEHTLKASNKKTPHLNLN